MKHQLTKVENEMIISQFVGTSKICDPNVDRVSKIDLLAIIVVLDEKSVLVKY